MPVWIVLTGTLSAILVFSRAFGSNSTMPCRLLKLPSTVLTPKLLISKVTDDFSGVNEQPTTYNRKKKEV
jgi:hypothetical protein